MKIDGKLNKLLHDLVYRPTPAGSERSGIDVLKNWVANNIGLNLPSYYEDHIGNTIFLAGGYGEKTILLTGHIDEVHCRITKIFENGLLSFKSVGGADRKSIFGNTVTVLGPSGTMIPAAVIKKAIHCEKTADADKVPEWKDMRLDVGAASAEEVEKMGIHVGSYVVYPRNYLSPFGEHRVCGTALDDKIGVIIAAGVAEKLSKSSSEEWWSKYKVLFGCTTQEETGLRGAHICARNINPDISIDFDVTHTTDDNLGVSDDEYCVIKLGEGPVIEWGCDKNESINQAIIDVAKASQIPYQNGVNRAGGTDTTKFELEARDCKTTLISIPQRSMHTPVEVCDWNDVRNAIDLTVKLIESCKL